MAVSKILAETIETIRNVASNEIGRITIDRAVVGLFFTGVKLSTGHVGACATPIKSIPEPSFRSCARLSGWERRLMRPSRRASPPCRPIPENGLRCCKTDRSREPRGCVKVSQAFRACKANV